MRAGSGQKLRRWLSRHSGSILIFVGSLTLRLLYLQGWLLPLETRQTPIYGDAYGYYVSATYMHDGALVPQMMSTRGPGYILFLAALFSLFGEGAWPVRYVQAVLGAITCVIIGRLGKELAGRRVGVIAGILAATYPSYILFTGRILTETLSTFLLWLGLLALVRGVRSRTWSWLVFAGVSVSLGSLTRPTLLAAAPFVILAAVVGIGGVTFRRKWALVICLAVAMLIPLGSWNFIARFSGNEPVAGSSGFEILTHYARTATLPEFRGWRTDDVSYSVIVMREQPGDWSLVSREMPLYPIAAAANLVFYHLWFLDNLWREVPMQLHWLQRAIVVLALFGLGLSLVRWRSFAPVLFLSVPLVAVSVKWIETRHNLPFMPIMFLLAALFLSGVVDLVRAGPRPSRKTLLVVGALVSTAILLYVTRLFRFAAVLPFLDPTTLGVVGDLVVIGVCAGWGAIVYRLAIGWVGRRKALLVGFLPVVLFAVGFGSYAYVRSEPRWRAWELDLHRQPHSVTQEIELTAPLPVDRIASAIWLVDLQTTFDLPPLEVALNGEWLSPEQYRWRRLFCNRAGGALKTGQQRRACNVYRKGLSSFTGAYGPSPQWWGVQVDPSRVGGMDSPSLSLARRGNVPGRRTSGRIGLGGTFSRGVAGSVYGPSVEGLTPGEGTSIYRWHVANDWRMWLSGPLASRRSKSSMDRAWTEPQAPGDSRVRVLIDNMERQRAHFNIRLLIEYKDGRRVIF